MRFLVGFGRFWWDFIVGDDWRIAAGVIVVLAVGALLVSQETLSGRTVVVLVGIGIAVVAIASIVVPGLRAARFRSER